MVNNTTQQPDKSLAMFYWLCDRYILSHGYVAALLCTFGIFANIANIYILSQPVLRSPVNVMLRMIAVADLSLMVLYLVYCSRYYIWQAATDECVPQSYSWAVSALIYANSSGMLYGYSIWLATALAGLRCFILYGMQRYSLHLQFYLSRLLCSVILGFVLICMIPHLLTFGIIHTGPLQWPRCRDRIGWSNDSYMIRPNDFNAHQNGMPLVFAFWIAGIIFKTIPCILLLIFMSILIRTLKQAAQRRHRLLNKGTTGKTSLEAVSSLINQATVLSTGGGSRKSSKVSTQLNSSMAKSSCKRTGERGQAGNPASNTSTTQHRNNLMLVAIVSVFITTQLPQGVLMMITGLSNSFRSKIYPRLAEVCDLLSLINSSITFLLYCRMNRQFRLVFLSTFKRPLDGAIQHTNTAFTNSLNTVINRVGYKRADNSCTTILKATIQLSPSRNSGYVSMEDMEDRKPSEEVLTVNTPIINQALSRGLEIRLDNSCADQINRKIVNKTLTHL